MNVNWEGTVYSLFILALNAGCGALKMVLLLVSLIEMIWSMLLSGSGNESGRRWQLC